MNGVRFLVHQSSRRSDNRKLVSITRSASVAVVSEIAPRWMTASSLRPSSQAGGAGGATLSASRGVSGGRVWPPWGRGGGGGGPHLVGGRALGEMPPFAPRAGAPPARIAGPPARLGPPPPIPPDNPGPAGDQQHSRSATAPFLCPSG